MQFRPMITNGGVHSPRTHAETTAWKIVDLIRIPETPVDPELPAEDRAAIEANREAWRQVKAQLEMQITAVLIRHHAGVQTGERDAIKSHGDARLTHDLAVSDHADVDAVLAEINPLFVPTIAATHFAKPEVQERLREIFTDDFGHAMEIERSTHADKSSGAVAEAYCHARRHHGARHAHVHAKEAAVGA